MHQKYVENNIERLMYSCKILSFRIKLCKTSYNLPMTGKSTNIR